MDRRGFLKFGAAGLAIVATPSLIVPKLSPTRLPSPDAKLFMPPRPQTVFGPLVKHVLPGEYNLSLSGLADGAYVELMDGAKVLRCINYTGQLLDFGWLTINQAGNLLLRVTQPQQSIHAQVSIKYSYS